LYTKQKRHYKAEEIQVKSVGIGRHKLGEKHPVTFKSLIVLYKAWNKPGKANKWRTKLPQTEAEKE